jgi:hypothetical protein
MRLSVVYKTSEGKVEEVILFDVESVKVVACGDILIFQIGREQPTYMSKEIVLSFIVSKN